MEGTLRGFSSFDWQDRGFNTPVRDQTKFDECEDCWIFGAVRNLTYTGTEVLIETSIDSWDTKDA